MSKIWSKWWFWLLVLVLGSFIALSGYLQYVQAEKQRAIDFVKNWRGDDGEGPTVVEAIAMTLTVAYGEPKGNVRAEWDAAMSDGGWRVDFYLTMNGEYLSLNFWTDFKTVKALDEDAKPIIELVNST